MSKLKPIKNLEANVKEGDLVRLVGKNFETTGYFSRIDGLGNPPDNFYAYFNCSPQLDDDAFDIDLNSWEHMGSRCDEGISLGIVDKYEILRKYKTERS